MHTFGAYFGLAASMALCDGKKVEKAGDKFGSTYTTDLFAMVGTVFLWMFWPSFNGALASGNAQHRVVVLKALCEAPGLDTYYERIGFSNTEAEFESAGLRPYYYDGEMVRR